MKKRIFKSFVALSLCFAMLLSYTPIYAVGEDEQQQQNNVTTEEVSETSLNSNDDANELSKKEEIKEQTKENIPEELITKSNSDTNNVNDVLKPEVTYKSHVQDLGWESKWASDISGTTGKSKRLEAIQIKLNDVTSGNVEYKTHIQDYGWESGWKKNGEISGTSGKSKRLEAIQIRLTDKLSEAYDIYYRVHAQNYGWLDWASNGEKAGTQGKSYRLEAIEIRIVAKGENAPGKTNEPFKKDDVKYQAHVSNIGWQNAVYDGEISGTTGRSLSMEALNITLIDPDIAGGIRYKAHVQNIGWQDWTSNGLNTGTTGRSLRMEALQVELTGEISKNYDVYYRLHVANFGWLGWAKNGEIAGSTGWSNAVEALEIKLVKSGSHAPGSTDNHYVSSEWKTQLKQIDETTKVNVLPDSLNQMKSLATATSIEVVATMNYKGKVTQQEKKEISTKSISNNGFEIDLKNYGKFQVTVNYKRGNTIVGSTKHQVAIAASEYNLAPLSATFPVVYFSLSLWDINKSQTGNTIPTIVMLDRPSAYNWNNLPEDVYGMPYLTKSEIARTSNFSIYKDYVKDLYEISPDAKFNLYINDITCSYIHDIIYSNNIPDGQYTITMLSDGSATFNIMNSTYNVDNPEEKHNTLIKTWNEAKEYAYKNGKNAPGWNWHSHWDCMYALLASEPTAQWWVARNNLFTSGDNNVFAEKIKSAVTVKNVNTLLQGLTAKGETTVAEFKNLYNFNDGYFDEAVKQNKKAMMILGTYVYNEKGFSDYARLTQLYYGDEYLYYYKGHPNTPTGLYPNKQAELKELNIGDVDSNVAAELILFFNPKINLSGYGTSTFSSASAEMACGLYNMNKQSAVNHTGVDYSGIDWFASAIDEKADKKIKELCPTGNTCYLVEFSDDLLALDEYDIGIYNATKGTLKYYKDVNGKYELVLTKSEESRVSYSSHVADYGWMSNVKEGSISGTVGEKKAMEAFVAKLGNVDYSGSLEYRAHVADIGWQSWVKEGKVAGTEGQSKQIEAISMRLTGEVSKKYDIYYRVHSQDYGWLGWAKNGANAGTEGASKRVEAIQVQLVEKGAKAPGTTANSFIKK